MTGSSRWHDVLATALVGTARRPVDDERRLLADAAVLAASRRAGWIARRAGAPPPAPPDGRPPAPDAAARLLEVVLGGDVPLPGGSAVVAGEWLACCAAAGRRVPPRLLPAVLDTATTHRSLRAAAVDAGGPLASWLGSANPAWRWAGAMAVDGDGAGDADERWRRGTRDERVALLRRLRCADPGRARALVASTWPTETAADRASFLCELAGSLQPADEPFLERALDDRAAGVRRAAAELLDGLPTSRRADRMAARLTPLVRRRADSVTVARPVAMDTGARRDGVRDDAPPGTALRDWWLVQLVTGTPLATWGDAGSAVEAVAGDDAVVTGLRRAALRQRDARWASVLLGRTGDPELLAVLDPGDAQRACLDALATAPDDRVGALLEACPGPWPPELGAAVVRRARRRPRLVAEPGVLASLATRLDPSLADVVGEWAAEGLRDTATARDVRRLHHALTLRAAIARQLA